MTLLAKIRNRAGLLVAIIGVALLVFVLESALSSGNFFFTGSDRFVGTIAGKSVSFDEFKQKVDNNLNIIRSKQQRAALDERTTNDVIEQTWGELVKETVTNAEYDKLGLSVSDDELFDLMIAHPHRVMVDGLKDPQTGMVIDMFRDPNTNMISPAKLNQYVQSINNPDAVADWKKREEYMRKIRIEEKYNNMIRKGIYVTKSQAQQEYEMQGTTASVSYIMKPYQSIADSTVTVSDDEIKAFYNKHKNEYKQEAGRKIEYVSFEMYPSDDDFKAVKNDMIKLTEDFKALKAKEDSAFVVTESDSHAYNLEYNKKGTLSPELDSLVFANEVGFVYGPYLENTVYRIAKLVKIGSKSDTAVKARHILIKVDDKTDVAKATAKADSLMKILNSKNFAEIAKKVSEDPGSGEKGGDLGWFHEGQMVPQFNDACFYGKKGEIQKVYSQFGIHLIEVLDKGKEVKVVQLAYVDRQVKPSEATLAQLYAKASKFANENTSYEAFSKSILREKLTKHSPPRDIKDSDLGIVGIESSRELLRWSWQAKKGEISGVIGLSDRYVVAAMVDIKEKGVAPLEQIKEEIIARAKEEKKAEKLVEEFKNAAQGQNSIDAIASKLALPVRTDSVLGAYSSNIGDNRQEDFVIGSLFVAKPNSLTQPIKGKNGVYIAYVGNVKHPEARTDWKNLQQQQANGYTYRVDFQVFEALKNSASISERYGQFDF